MFAGLVNGGKGGPGLPITLSRTCTGEGPLIRAVESASVFFPHQELKVCECVCVEYANVIIVCTISLLSAGLFFNIFFLSGREKGRGWCADCQLLFIFPPVCLDKRHKIQITTSVNTVRIMGNIEDTELGFCYLYNTTVLKYLKSKNT